MEQNEKPYQSLAWLATGILIIAAALASFVPELEYHHWAFISANTLWVYVGWLWKEQSLIVLNAGANHNIYFRFNLLVNIFF